MPMPGGGRGWGTTAWNRRLPRPRLPRPGYVLGDEQPPTTGSLPLFLLAEGRLLSLALSSGLPGPLRLPVPGGALKRQPNSCEDMVNRSRFTSQIVVAAANIAG